MKNLAKLVVVFIFALIGLVMLVNHGVSTSGSFTVSAQEANTSPTPPDNSNMETNVASNSNATNATTVPAGARKIPAEFTLGLDSVSEYGEAPFNHDNHAFKKYSADGQSIVTCVECHHTDQPKSSMKPPLVTSERDFVLTMELYQSGTFKVSGCRDCHFQEGAVPDEKEMPFIVFSKDGVDETKEYNNEIAYHLNCNTCHDEAARLRPEVRKNPGFSTTKECNICHITY